MLASVSLATLAPARAASSSTLENCTDTIKIDAIQGKAKFPKGAAVVTSLRNVTITGCDMEIKANSASSPNFSVENSSWTLEGNVRIRAIQQGSRINADQAVVKFGDNEIQLITITGKPAEFEQKRPDSDLVTRGHAGQMIYEASAGVVRMLDNAWITDGAGKTLESPALWYDIRKAEMGYSSSEGKGKSGSGSTGEGDRVIITIDPRASKNAKKKDDGPPPATPPSSDTRGAPTPPAKP